MAATLKRCDWCGNEPLYIAYHDEEWGVPVRDERTLFEFLILEGAQAGLNWLTILKKREGYRKAFADFDPERVARFTEARQAKLLQDPGIVRNRLKVKAATTNAKAWLKLRKEPGGPVDFLWSFVGGKPIQNKWRHMGDVPATTAESDAMSKELKRRGFTFVGSTICYAFMQAVGMVNDHLITCPRHKEVARLA